MNIFNRILCRPVLLNDVLSVTIEGKFRSYFEIHIRPTSILVILVLRKHGVVEILSC